MKHRLVKGVLLDLVHITRVPHLGLKARSTLSDHFLNVILGIRAGPAQPICPPLVDCRRPVRQLCRLQKIDGFACTGGDCIAGKSWLCTGPFPFMLSHCVARIRMPHQEGWTVRVPLEANGGDVEVLGDRQQHIVLLLFVHVQGLRAIR